MRASWSVRRMAWRPSVFSLPDCRVDDLWPRLGLLLVLLRRLVTAGSGRGALPGRIGRRGGTAVFGPAARCRPVRTGDHQVGTPGRLCNVRPDLPVPIGTARRAPPDDVTGPAGGGKAGAGSRAYRGSGEAGSRAHGTPFTPGGMLSRSRDAPWFRCMQAAFGWAAAGGAPGRSESSRVRKVTSAADGARFICLRNLLLRGRLPTSGRRTRQRIWCRTRTAPHHGGRARRARSGLHEHRVPVV